MSVHPNKTAIRAVDACGGIYTTAEMSSRFAEGHSAALCEAMKAVVEADALAAELLAALTDLERYLRDTPHHNAMPAAHARAVIAKAARSDR